MKRKLARTFLLMTALTGFVLPGAAPAQAQDEGVEVCYVEIHVHVYPRVYWENDRIGVEIGEYHPHQNCVVIYP